MKKTFLFFCLSMLSFLAFSQPVSQYLGSPTTAVKTRGIHIIDSVLSVPKRLSGLFKDTGSVYYRIADSSIQVWTGSQWLTIGANDPNKVPLSRTITINGNTQDLSANRTWTLTKTDVGLDNVDNTSDLNKPVSTAQQAALDDTSLAIRSAITTPDKIVIGPEVDPLYGITVKKVYDNVTQSNFGTTVGKYPIYADKDVRFTEDSMSMWPVPGDNAGLNILRYKGRSVMNFENNINRFTGHHAVILFDKYPGFADTVTVMGRVSPLTGISAPAGFAGILSFGGAGVVNAPVLGKGWFSALSAEVQLSGNSLYNNLENAIWVHAGIHGSGGPNSVKNGYGVYINGFNNSVTNKYALYQQGTLDTVQFNGKIRIPNLTTQTDTTSYKPTVVDANGNLFRLTYWPVGSGGGGGITSLNALTDATQTFTTGTTGSDFNISSSSGVHTFNIPDASATARGLITTGVQTFAGNKTFSNLVTGAGIVSTAGVVAGTSAILGWTGRSTMRSAVNGNIMISNQAGTDMGILQFGGTTSSYPGLQRSGAGLIAALADGSAHTTLTASGLTLSDLAGTGTRIGTVSSTGVAGAITNGTDGQVMTMVSGSPAWANNASVQTTGNQTVAGIKTFTDRMAITKGAGVTPDVNNLLYLGRNEPGNFYPLGIFEDETDNGYAQFGVWGKARKWNFGVGNGPSSFFGVQDKFYILDATSNNIRFTIDTDGTVEIPELLKAKGNVATRIRTITSSTTIDEYDHTLLIDASGGPVTVTLPTSASSYYGGYGISYIFKRIDNSGNTITIAATGSDTIDGNATAGLNITALQTITIQAAGGTAWYIIKN